MFDFAKKVIKRFAAAALVLTLSAGFANAKEELLVSGSTTILPLMQKVVEAYLAKNPGSNISVSGGGSGNGIKALLDKTADIAMSSRPIKEAELALAKERKLEVNTINLGSENIVPIVNPENPVKNLTVEQLKEIFTGKITNWKEVGGVDKSIIVISRDTSSGTYEAFNELVMKKEKVTPRALLQSSSGAVLQIISKNKYAIGYDSYGYVNKTVHALTVNGKTGAPSVKEANYPLKRNLYLYTVGKSEKPVVFLKFLFSPEGRKIINENGIVVPEE